MSADVIELRGTKTGRERLRDLEDEVFGANARRVNGHIERGHGSAFSKLDVPTQQKFLALDRLIETEEVLVSANERLRLSAEAAQAAEASRTAALAIVKVITP